MAEALAVVGLVAAIVQFTDTGAKVVKRLDQYRSTIKKAPEFRKVRTQLPLFIDALERTKKQADDGQVSEQTAKALKPSVDRCLEQVLRLSEILERESPSTEDSKWKRRKKALTSLFNDKDVKEIVEDLDSHARILTFHHATGNSSQVASPTEPNPPQGKKPQRDILHAKVVHQTSPLSVVEPGQAPCFTVKFAREENFVGREDIITEIDRRLMGGQHRIAVAGIGGVGKSQIAIEYCYRYKAAHPEANVFWVHGSNLSRFSAAYQEIARQLALPGIDEPNVDIFQLVCTWLNCEANGPWLLVLDNVDDIETMFGSEEGQEAPTGLVNHLPHSSRGAMVMTTRDRRIGERLVKQERPISVMPYGTEDAKHLLQKSLRDDDLNDVDAMALLEALDYLPLAINQAAAFMRENGVSLKSYLKSLEAGSQEATALLAEAYSDPGRDPDSQNSVFQTWKVSFESIRKQKPRAAEMLSLMAMLDRQAIPVRLLERYNERNIDFIKAIGTLKAFSLITEQAEGVTVGMHRLVQLATQSWLELEGLVEESQEMALAAVHQYCLTSSSRTAYLDINPQVQVVLGFVFTKDWCLVQRAFILSLDAAYDQAKGHYAAALSKCENALSISEKLLEEDHPLVVEIRNKLGGILQLTAKYDAAEEMLRQVLVKRERSLGPDHLDTLVTMDYLGHTLCLQAKYKAAEALQKEVLKRSERVLGPAHYQTMMRVSSLSSLRSIEGDYELAAAMKRQVLNVFEKVFGPEHLETLWCRYCLAHVIYLQGKPEVAEAMTRQVVEDYRKALGPEHPSYLNILDGLLQMVASQERWVEAEVLAREELDALERVLGLDHPLTMRCRSTLAFILGRLDRFEAAEAMSQIVLDRLDKALSHDKLWSPIMLHRIGYTYEDQGKYEAAEALHRRGLEIYQEMFGSDHPFTMASMYSVADILGKRKQFDQACALYKRASMGLQMTLGPDHILTLECIENFASLRRRHPNFSIRFPARLQNLSAVISALPIVPFRWKGTRVSK